MMENTDASMCAKHPEMYAVADGECFQCRNEREDRDSLFVVYILKGTVGSGSGLFWQEAIQVPDKATSADISRHYLMAPNVLGVVVVRKSEMNRVNYLGVPSPIPKPE